MLVRSTPHSAGGGAARPGLRCSPQTGRPEIATRKQASNKWLALIGSLLKALTMKCNGCKWPVLSRASLVSGAGRGRERPWEKAVGKGAAFVMDEIPIRWPEILTVRAIGSASSTKEHGEASD